MTWSRCFSYGLLVAVVSLATADVSARDGQTVFAESCATCHGEAGGGTDAFPQPLAGDLSVSQLAALVQETMPEDDPGSLSNDEARAVAEFAFHGFYSPVAKARSQPPRIELSRLTVRQHRQSLADLVASFVGTPNIGDERGMKGEYFPSRHFKDRVFERVDANIDFDIGSESPVAQMKDADQFSIRWQGSLLVSETGWHEFVVRTSQATRLFVNDNEHAIVDAWVKSGDEHEHVGRAYLLAGRTYPIRLEFSRNNQGVSDEKVHSQHEQLEKASINLLWKPPRGKLETIPSRAIAPDWSPEVFVCTTPFPPDDRSYGWERGTSISPAWDEATTTAAIEAAEYVATHIDELAKTTLSDEQRPAKIKDFCAAFVESAFRTPLDEAIREQYVDRHFAAAEQESVALRRVVLLALKSPRFLFREIDASGGDRNTAARLAYIVSDSFPPDWLSRQADEGKLTDESNRRLAAQRMLESRVARQKQREFLRTWLQIDGVVEMQKDVEQFPGFDETMVSDLRTSLELFLDELLSSETADYRELFLAQEIYANDRIVNYYGGETSDPRFLKYRLDDGRRAGMLTHPYMMAMFAHHDSTSPIHRGVFLARSVLGQTLKPPPDAVAPFAADLHPELTTRERVAMQTRPAACMTCHHVINPLGFALERFDAVGRYRTVERERPINDRGRYQPRNGDAVEFSGARELADYLAASSQVSEAFVEQMFHFMVQQSIAAYGVETKPKLHQAFISSGYNIRQLAIEIAVAASPIGREHDAESLANQP